MVNKFHNHKKNLSFSDVKEPIKPMTFLHKKDVEKMINLSKNFDLPGYHAEYSQFEEKAKKMKLINRKRRTDANANILSPLSLTQNVSETTIEEVVE